MASIVPYLSPFPPFFLSLSLSLSVFSLSSHLKLHNPIFFSYDPIPNPNHQF